MRNDSMWKIPLVRELAVVLVIKLAVLFTIKSLYFSDPVKVDADKLLNRSPSQWIESPCTQEQQSECNHN